MLGPLEDLTLCDESHVELRVGKLMVSCIGCIKASVGWTWVVFCAVETSGMLQGSELAFVVDCTWQHGSRDAALFLRYDPESFGEDKPLI